MKHKKKLVPHAVRNQFIASGKWSLDPIYGLVEYEDELVETASMLDLHLIDYSKLKAGDVFIPLEEDREYHYDEINLYSMKMNFSNWSLTGHDEAPLSVDYNTYDKVYVVL
jgi:hypothetical protein